MRTCLVFICFLVATFAMSVKGKHHGRHRGLQKTSIKEKDGITEEDNNPQVSPTLVPFDVSSMEKEDGEPSSDSNTSAQKIKEVNGKTDQSTAVLMSEEELVDLLKKESEEEEEDGEVKELEDEEADTSKVLKKTKGKGEKKISEESTEVKDEEEVRDEGMEEKEKEGVKEMLLEKKVENPAGREEKVASPEETESSTESEIIADLDYAADSGVVRPLQTVSAEVITSAHEIQSIAKKDASDDQNKEDHEAEFQQDMQTTSDDVHDDDTAAKSEEKSTKQEEPQSNIDPGKEEEAVKDDSKAQTKAKTRMQRRNQRARKHSPQKDEGHPEQTQSEQEPQESQEPGTRGGLNKAKRRRAEKWGHLVGLNPVQIRSSVNLHPQSKPSVTGDIYVEESLTDPCYNFRCKRGKTCKLDADNKPHCACQEPAECPASTNTFDNVCGTDNRTYDTSCHLFATKCNLDGTKTGHRLHLDYSGPCKLIPPCLENELSQFPLRMRDWLKNVLLQLYELDSMSPGYLTPKQRFKVKKIFENERRLHPGNHTVQLLAQDFEKNYNMYIYPVHWQFAQLDQHPSDRVLTHSELAPLRVPLVPMEHCTSHFFQKCDADKDKQVSFKEWTSCFGIKNDDMDPNLLF
ncbi:SPARC-like protein 1 isoform X1 [Oryzias latipes]|uniref:SPARC-like protein 1 isoform X1 n=1 Tax=Oryzias latipes TaxID=8090 RepID=UPI0005CC0DAC|nr:SPARC-like protein 1 isoform X1 [Oryzias latipes]XP_011473997.1 SPARC-like protein 1 isoform X1 [Oryzias latipes]